MRVRRRLWRRPESVFTAGYPAVRMRQWISSLRETLRMIRTCIAVIMGKAITMERDTGAGKTGMDVLAMEAVNSKSKEGNHAVSQTWKNGIDGK